MRRTIIGIASIGESDASLVRSLAPAVETAFEAITVLAPALTLPEDARGPHQGQYRSTRILDELAAARSWEWERLLGVADVDLYAPGLNFVFGEADTARGVAVLSLARLHAAPELVARRARTEAIHELGHTYGLGHCSDARCVMWFSNTLAETDAKTAAFCAVHAGELTRRLDRLREA